MAGNSQPTRKLALTEVPDDVWDAAKFAAKDKLEDVVWYLPKSAGGHYVMIIRVNGDHRTNKFGVVVHEDDSGRRTLEQFNRIINPLSKEMA